MLQCASIFSYLNRVESSITSLKEVRKLLTYTGSGGLSLCLLSYMGNLGGSSANLYLRKVGGRKISSSISGGGTTAAIPKRLRGVFLCRIYGGSVMTLCLSSSTPAFSNVGFLAYALSVVTF